MEPTTVYFLMVLLAGPGQQPAATYAYADANDCLKMAGNFNSLANGNSMHWCVRRGPDGKMYPIVLGSEPGK